MACLYGCFIGFGSSIGIQANITPLAARRCVTPTHKLKLILTDQLASFALGYMDVIILILYLRYILNLDFQGQMGKMLVVSFFGSLIGVSMLRLVMIKNPLNTVITFPPDHEKGCHHQHHTHLTIYCFQPAPGYCACVLIPS